MDINFKEISSFWLIFVFILKMCYISCNIPYYFDLNLSGSSFCETMIVCLVVVKKDHFNNAIKTNFVRIHFLKHFLLSWKGMQVNNLATRLQY